MPSVFIGVSPTLAVLEASEVLASYTSFNPSASISVNTPGVIYPWVVWASILSGIPSPSESRSSLLGMPSLSKSKSV